MQQKQQRICKCIDPLNICSLDFYRGDSFKTYIGWFWAGCIERNLVKGRPPDWNSCHGGAEAEWADCTHSVSWWAGARAEDGELAIICSNAGIQSFSLATSPFCKTSIFWYILNFAQSLESLINYRVVYTACKYLCNVLWIPLSEHQPSTLWWRWRWRWRFFKERSATSTSLTVTQLRPSR